MAGTPCAILHIPHSEVVAFQDWDSLHDAGHSEPCTDMDRAIRESGITVNNEATREIVFLRGNASNFK